MRIASTRDGGYWSVMTRKTAIHGEATKGKESVEYRTWAGMKNRCYNPNEPAFRRYGGRGIVMCDAWKDSFPAFLTDMGRRPGPGYSIDRIDNDGPYSPGNCRWATRAEQNSNYSRNRVLKLNGAARIVAAWAQETGIPAETISARIDVLGWSVEAALSTPVGTIHRDPGKDRKTHCKNGHEYTPENSGRNGAGWRFCRICSRERQRDYMRAKRSRKD